MAKGSSRELRGNPKTGTVGRRRGKGPRPRKGPHYELAPVLAPALETTPEQYESYLSNYKTYVQFVRQWRSERNARGISTQREEPLQQGVSDVEAPRGASKSTSQVERPQGEGKTRRRKLRKERAQRATSLRKEAERLRAETAKVKAQVELKDARQKLAKANDGQHFVNSRERRAKARAHRFHQPKAAAEMVATSKEVMPEASSTPAKEVVKEHPGYRGAHITVSKDDVTGKKVVTQRGHALPLVGGAPTAPSVAGSSALGKPRMSDAEYEARRKAKREAEEAAHRKMLAERSAPVQTPATICPHGVRMDAPCKACLRKINNKY